MYLLLQPTYCVFPVTIICDIWWDREQLLPESKCGFSRSLLVLHYTRPLMTLTTFHKPLNSIFFLFLSAFSIFLFVPFAPSRGQVMFTQTSLVASPRSIAFLQLHSGKSHFLSLRILRMSLLSRNECRWWRSQSKHTLNHWSIFLWAFVSWRHRRWSFFMSGAVSFSYSKHHTTKVVPFTHETTVWIYTSTSTQCGLSVFFISW